MKKLNGIFREWVKVRNGDAIAPIVWGYCVVHFSQPEFSGNALHTSSIVRIVEFETFKIAETRNNFYALLGPELQPPEDADISPRDFVLEQHGRTKEIDRFANAAINADPKCFQCGGSGIYKRDDRHLAICDRCCKHNRGWWQLEGGYGADNGRWACSAGCGRIVDVPPLELEFLPRAET